MDQNNKPKTIKENIYLYLEISEILKGSLKDAAKNILAIENKIGSDTKKRYTDFEIEYIYCYDESPEIIIKGVRTETPEELATRLALNKHQNRLRKARALKLKKTKAENEIKLYQKLQKKYGQVKK